MKAKKFVLIYFKTVKAKNILHCNLSEEEDATVTLVVLYQVRFTFFSLKNKNIYIRYIWIFGTEKTLKVKSLTQLCSS